MRPHDAGEIDDSIEFKDHGRRWLKLLLIAVVVGAVALVSSGPVYRAGKGWRARQLSPKAEVALAAGDWDAAGRLVQTLLRLAPREPEVLRCVARYCTRLGLLEGMSYWELLLASPEHSRADELAYLDFAISLNQFDKSLPRLNALLRANPRDAEALRLLLRHLEAAGDRPAMVQRARQWLEADPRSANAQFALGTILIQAADNASREEGSRLLWGLALASEERSDDAMERLSRLPWLTPAENALLLRRLSSRPADWLVAANLRLKMFPDRRASVVQDIANTTTNQADFMMKSAGMAWLADNGAYARLLTILPAPMAATNAVYASLRVEALVQEGRFSDAEEMIQGHTNTIEAFMAACARASESVKSGRRDQASAYLQYAVEAAHDRPRALGYIANYAIRLNQPREALAALIRLMRWPPAVVDAGKQATEIARALRDDRSLHEIARQMAQFAPNDEEWMIVEAYQACLIGVAPLTPSSRLLALSPEHKKLSLYAPALALTLLREKRASEALGVFEGAASGGQGQNPIDPRWRVAYTAALGANQQREAARGSARKIDWNLLSPAEQELVAPWRN